ncbi:carbamoyltransferase HypF [Hydrogenovibrio sp. SC-1]|uniref:carbamoyltransferase HypF n=1 Tax=Hydrogenovibrio sp. SC-1 TaxID=2065820 RepID=UPI0013040A8B|nr:carbamoyltransferase HypF [Hydrogenovibrio sp. SC-1]
MNDVKHQYTILTGKVQGVGFRPWVFQQAQQLDLLGSVYNAGQSVVLHLQGLESQLDEFQQRLQHQLPPQAQIDQISQKALPLADFQQFQILPSQSDESVPSSLEIPVDLALCDACLAEFHDPTNRRYQDPFISCSDCGPRYSMLRAMPYDRANTAMVAFPLCECCQQEYQDPTNRRFHTQGICCPDCGPELAYYNAKQCLIYKGLEAVLQLKNRLEQAGLVAFKGVGGFHLLADATQTVAVEKLRQCKHRLEKPFAILCRDLEMAQQLADMSAHEKSLLCSPAHPIVLVKRRQDSVLAQSLSDSIAPGLTCIGLFLACTPLQQLLFESVSTPLVATSANLSGEPILTHADAVFRQFGQTSLVDGVLDFNRDIENPCDDSVVQSVAGKTVTLRMARGLAPFSLSIPAKNDPTHGARQAWPFLAVGAQQKSTFAMGRNNQVLLSVEGGDLHALAAQQQFNTQIHRLSQWTGVAPQTWVCDPHPNYVSSKWAQQQAESEHSVNKVQHHYAHLLAGMAEHGLTEPVLGFSWDGSGYGLDKTLWGGEVMLASIQGFERLCHLQPMVLLGGEKAIRQPRRIALAWLFERYALETVLDMKLPTLKAFSELEIRQLYQLYQQKINCPMTSSMGRVWDGVASLIGLKQQLGYEGQNGLLMAEQYDFSIKEAYDFKVSDQKIDLSQMVEHLLFDQQAGISQSRMVSQFINMQVNLVAHLAKQNPDLPVVVSGGVFQNKVLLQQLIKYFENQSQKFYFQQNTPLNDGGIALGQAWWFLHQTR